MNTPEKLSVLFMATRDWANPAAAGGDVQMWEYARYLAAQGHRVTFLASIFSGALKEEILDGVRVVRLGGVLTLWIQTFLYYKVRCRETFDVVVTEGFGGSRIPRFAPLYVKEPIVTEWHQIHSALFAAQYPTLLTPPLNLLERLTAYLHRHTLVRAGTREWQEAFPRIGFRRENVFLVPVSIREEWLREQRTTHIFEPRIMWLGKFRRYKCPDHVILAMKEVVKQIPDARLVLAGRHDDRAYERRLRGLVEELGLSENVEFRLDVTEEEKRSHLESCRAMVLPSSVEGFGIVVLEANACGLPVIASSGVPEGAVRHDQNGLRYPFGDIPALAESIVRLLRDDELYLRLSGSSLAFAAEFAWRDVGEQYERVLRTAAKCRTGLYEPARP